MNVIVVRRDTKEAGGCNGCSYPDGEHGTIFEINISNLKFRLCRICLDELEQGMAGLALRKPVRTNHEN